MALLTLTTDLGDRDHYAASLKAAILSLAPELNLVDITHNIPEFSLIEGGFILRNVFHRFPAGTVHLLGIDPDSGARQGIAMAHEGHFFVAADNGALGLVKRNEDARFVSISRAGLNLNPRGRSFFVQNVLAPAAAFLAGGGAFEELGEACEANELMWGSPSYTENALRGVILHIDRFGNAITNISKDEFLLRKADRSFQVFIRNIRLQRIMSSYADVVKGEALAVFGDHGLLEIAIREGSAEQLLGLKSHDMLTIEFYN